MMYFSLEDDRINLENIAGYGAQGPQGLRIYFSSGETKGYGFGSTEERDQVLEQLDRRVGLSSQYEAF